MAAITKSVSSVSFPTCIMSLVWH